MKSTGQGFDISLCETEVELRETFPVMVQLRTHLSVDGYLAQVDRQRREQRYRIVALRTDGIIRAVAGFRLGSALSYGDYVYVDDLVSDQSARSAGHGAQLLAWIAAFGKQQGCTSLHLDSGVQRHDAHRFYLRERMDIVFYHFRKAL